MEFDSVLKMRQSTRKYKDTPVSDEQIAAILDAANHAPVGSNQYHDLHITVVKNQEKLLYLCEAAWERFSKMQKLEDIAGDTVDKGKSLEKKTNLFYGAPVVFFISHKEQNLQAGIEWSNVTSLVNTMHLKATDLGLGSVYMWGALESMRMISELDHTDVLELPAEYKPLIALAVGYPQTELQEHDLKHAPISVNRID